VRHLAARRVRDLPATVGIRDRAVDKVGDARTREIVKVRAQLDAIGGLAGYSGEKWSPLESWLIMSKSFRIAIYYFVYSSSMAGVRLHGCMPDEIDSRRMHLAHVGFRSQQSP
jgi:hypothetical protein